MLARNQRIQLGRKFHHNAVAFHAFNRACYDVFMRFQKMIQNLLALGIADALQDDLLGGLRGLPSEGFVGQLFFVVIAHADLDFRLLFLDLLNGFFQLGIGVIQVFHDEPFADGFVVACFAVNADFQIHLLAIGFFLGGDAQRDFQRFKYDFVADVFFACQGFGKQQYLFAHVVSPNG